MVKRKLTNKQVRNQAKIQSDRIGRAKQRAQKIEKALQSSELGPEQRGLLIAHFGVHLIVEDEQGNLHQCQHRQTIGPLVTGDRVIWRTFQDQTGVIVALEERKSLLIKPFGKHDVRPMASNVDLVVVVVAPLPPPSATTLDRYLVMAELLHLPCLIVINKIDLLEDEGHQAFLDHMQVYQNLGYPWVEASTHTEHGLDELKARLQSHTSILLGQSGVGKSSLISALVPDADILIGQLSTSSNLGKHTTTAARLYHLPKGGDLIDSPGIRRFGLWHLSKEVLIQGFKEFHPFIGACKFRNCKHIDEPECALKKAAEQGKIHARRLQNYHELLESHARIEK